MAKKKTAAKKEKSFEESHWETANKLRGSVESSEYKHVVLSLIFLKFVSDKFEERRAGGKEEVSLLHHTSFASGAESAKLDKVIQANLADLGYGDQEGTTNHG